MDVSRLDALTRSLAAAPSRRAALQLLTGFSLGGVFASQALGTEARTRKKRKRSKKKEKKGKDDKGKNTPNLCGGLASPTFCDQLIGGNAFAVIPQGGFGGLSVIAVGSYDGTSLPFLVRNGTSKDLHDLSATAIARNSSGQLVGSGSDQEISPNIVRSGAVAMGYIYFDGVDFDPGTSFSIRVTADGADDWKYENERDLVFGEANYTNGRVVGSMINRYREIITGPIEYMLTCFNAEGRILAQYEQFSGINALAPGQQDFFQFSSYSGPLDCPYYLVAGSGFSD